MLLTKLKKIFTLWCVVCVLFLCCAQSIVYAAEIKKPLIAAELSEEQLFLIVMQMASSNYIESEITVEYVEFTHDAWGELLNNRGAAADPYVLKMLDYYLGESTASGVFMSLVCRRGRILAELRKIKKRGPKCDLKYQKICADPELWG